MHKMLVKQSHPKPAEVGVELSPEDLDQLRGGGTSSLATAAGGSGHSAKERAIQDLEAVKDGIRDY